MLKLLAYLDQALSKWIANKEKYKSFKGNKYVRKTCGYNKQRKLLISDFENDLYTYCKDLRRESKSVTVHCLEVVQQYNNDFIDSHVRKVNLNH